MDVRFAVAAFALTSINGVSPVTWTVSDNPGSASVSSTLRCWPSDRIAADFAGLKPCRLADT